MNVSQVLCAAGPVDAVTNQGLAWRKVFTGWGWGGHDYAAHIAPGIESGALRPLRDLKRTAKGIVLLHYSGYVYGLEELLQDGRRSLLMSHNVTPARYFWAYAPVDAARCQLARGQLAALAGSAGALAGVSAFNARELGGLSGRRAEVIPVLFDTAALPQAREATQAGPPTILFVGRLAPHKRQDLVIRAFARYREHVPEARLLLVGTALSPDFRQALRQLADRLAPDAVSLACDLNAEQLADVYRSADVFLCLSEHEGFCIPLLEAFHFGVPVIARDCAAVGEVVGDAGVLLAPQESVATIAEVVRIVVDDEELSAELRERGRARLERFDRARTERLLRESLERLAG